MKVTHRVYRGLSLLGFVLLAFSSCEKLVDVEAPQSQVSTNIVFEDELTATAAIAGLYVNISDLDGVFNNIYFPSLSADDLMLGGANTDVQFYQNELTSINNRIESCWRYYYNNVYKANSILEALDKSTKLSTSFKNQLRGEAKFMRAFHHFYLVNLFGDVPYITSTDYRINGLVPRMPVADVYQKIITDLLDAKNVLSLDYSFSQGERVRVNKWAASALLARVYLYVGEWVKAELYSSEVIDRIVLYGLMTSPNSVFLKNSNEAILQIIPPVDRKYTVEASMFYRPNYLSDYPVIANGLINSFETNDKRRADWIGTGNNGTVTWYYPTKYKEYNSTAVGAEYSTVLRLAEQFLIRAEARTKQNKLTGSGSAASDINVIRNRAGLPNTAAFNQVGLLHAIEQERRLELFTEAGHRWFDLKRTGRADAVLSAIKPGWSVTDMLYPIPYSELQLNPNLKQNPGY